MTPATHPTHEEVIPAVRAVLAGEPVERAARRIRMRPTALLDAVDVFTQAGARALARQDLSAHWSQFYVEFTDWATAEQTARDHLVPMIRRLDNRDDTPLWWFTRKHPCWRLRFYAGPEDVIHSELDALTKAGLLRHWWPGIYEPETPAFGGVMGMLSAHRLFTADSHHILHHPRAPLGRRELSVLLCTTLMRAAGLEWYEQGDVWDRVITEEQRSDTSQVPAKRVDEVTEQIRKLLLSNIDPKGPLLMPNGPLNPVTQWFDSFRVTGESLHRSVQSGDLDRGLRRVLAYHIIFHWNRMGFSISTQSALALGARTAILDPPSNRG
ncbi:thiopeptide-type bacteriocin biosynthesis protein [Streptomyces sp. NPDC004732]|uniref:thiopeptide-type bacteriocin biosynthesis protein n=1 Tax=Streptomyces sp. NPDC004732 TaxID=3154290 RepID=UPI0033BCB512